MHTAIPSLFGAEKAGNKDGSIPEYSGQPLEPPASYNPKDPGRHPDPFNEKPLFSITAQNADQHAEKLDACRWRDRLTTSP